MANVQAKRTPEQDLWIRYFTSSKEVKKLINKYGKTSFEIQIIMKDTDYNKCYFYEQELIDKHLGMELCLNGFCHLTGKFSRAGMLSPKKGRPVSAETKIRMSIVATGKYPNDETKIKMSESHKGKCLSANTRAKISNTHKGMPSPMKDKSHSNEARIKMSVANTGKILSDETKEKMSAAKAGKPTPRLTCPHCNKIGGYGPMIQWHFGNCKKKP